MTTKLLSCPRCHGTGKFNRDDYCLCCRGAKTFDAQSALDRLHDYFRNPKYAERVNASRDLVKQRDALEVFVRQNLLRCDIGPFDYLLALYDKIAPFGMESESEGEIIALARAILADAPKTIRDQRTVQIDVQLLARLASALQDFDARGR